MGKGCGFMLEMYIKMSHVLRKGTAIHGGFAYLVIML